MARHPALRSKAVEVQRDREMRREARRAYVELEREILESAPIDGEHDPEALLAALREAAELTGPAELEPPAAPLLGRYRLLRELSQGELGPVYLGADLERDETCVIARLGGRPELAPRCLADARAVAAIDHPNVLRVRDFGQADDGAAVIVVDPPRGESLAALLEREGPLPWARVQHLMIQICRALEAAHERGLVHRNLELDNILRIERADDPDFVVVFEFGLARLRGGGLHLGETGLLVGAPETMAPEQARGAATDARTDVYAAGAVMYTLLCGRPPFWARSFVGMRNQHLLVAPEPPSGQAPAAEIFDELSDEVDAIVLRALAKEPANRFASMAAMRAAIEAVGTGLGPIPVFERGDTFEDEEPPTMDLVVGLVERGSSIGRRGRIRLRRASRERARPPGPPQPSTPRAEPRRIHPALGVLLVTAIAVLAGLLGYAAVMRLGEPPDATASDS